MKIEKPKTCLKTVTPSPTLDEMFIHLKGTLDEMFNHLKGTLLTKMTYAPISGVVL